MQKVCLSSLVLLFVVVYIYIGKIITWFCVGKTGDALNALRTNLADPGNVLQSWDPTLVNPCTWFHVTCNSENSVTRV